jgi:hypothetical protein
MLADDPRVYQSLFALRRRPGRASRSAQADRAPEDPEWIGSDLGKEAPGILAGQPQMHCQKSLQPEHITKLYRSYVLNGNARKVTRHRGKSPRQAAFFFRSPELRFHAANLASLFVLYGLLRATAQGVESSYQVGSLESGALLCVGYEAYRELHSPAAISFEHAWFLLLALARRDEIALRRCAQCGGVRLQDLLAKRDPTCLTCAPDNMLSG